MQQDWDTAWHLGGLSHRMAHCESAVADIKDDQKALRTELDKLKAWATRFAILAALWSAAIAAHWGREEASDVLALVIKAALSGLIKH